MNQLLQVLFALNRTYFMDDKTALGEVAELERAPQQFEPRVQNALAHLGDSPAEHLEAIGIVTQLFQETVALTNGLYQPRFMLPRDYLQAVEKAD